MRKSLRLLLVMPLATVTAAAGILHAHPGTALATCGGSDRQQQNYGSVGNEGDLYTDRCTPLGAAATTTAPGTWAGTNLSWQNARLMYSNGNEWHSTGHLTYSGGPYYTAYYKNPNYPTCTSIYAESDAAYGGYVSVSSHGSNYNLC